MFHLKCDTFTTLAMTLMVMEKERNTTFQQFLKTGFNLAAFIVGYEKAAGSLLNQ